MTKLKIIKTLVSQGTYQEILSWILNKASCESSYVCVSNVHMLIEAYKDNDFNIIVNEAAMATPDGMPLAKAMKSLYGINQERVAGMDLMPDLMREAEKENLSVYIYGSTDEVIDKIKLKAKNEFPKLKIEGYSPPFRILSQEEKDNVLKQINKFNPSFVFVALGCPKQEKWMAEHKGKVHACMVGLGGALEVYAGIKDRAPIWMRENSLEWLYRLIQDPKRLWKRYFVTNTLFIGLFIIQYIKIKLFKRFD